MRLKWAKCPATGAKADCKPLIGGLNRCITWTARHEHISKSLKQTVPSPGTRCPQGEHCRLASLYAMAYLGWCAARRWHADDGPTVEVRERRYADARREEPWPSRRAALSKLEGRLRVTACPPSQRPRCPEPVISIGDAPIQSVAIDIPWSCPRITGHGLCAGWRLPGLGGALLMLPELPRRAHLQARVRMHDVEVFEGRR